MTRNALAAAGFLRREAGGTVYWTRTPPAAAPAAAPWVLVHGVNDQAGSWFRIAPDLARGRQVVIVDLPGHGESAPADGPLPLDMMVARLGAVIAAAIPAGSPVVLAGNSLGGWVAALFVLAEPECVAHLVLEAAGGLARPFASPVVATTREEAHQVLRAVHGPRFDPPGWLVDAILERAAASPMLRVTGTEERVLDPHLGSIRCPVTLVWGRDDGILPLDYADAFQRGIPGSSLEVIDGAAHIPHVQRPEEILRCFLAIC